MSLLNNHFDPFSLSNITEVGIPGNLPELEETMRTESRSIFCVCDNVFTTPITVFFF